MLTRRQYVLALTGALAIAAMTPVQGEEAPPGRLVEVDAHRMHINCTGTGSPAVIMDAGLGGTALDWSLVQPLVSAYTTACSYDRSGYGWSEASSRSRSSGSIADELHGLLASAGVPPPYVLVGHSFGGFNVRMFAGKYPDEMAGLILIDASHEAQFERFERDFGVNLAPRRGGFIRLSPPQVPSGLPARARAEAIRQAATAAAMLTVRDELLAFRASAEQVALGPELPDVPLVVLTRGQQQWRGVAKGPALEALWLELQSSLVQLATDRSHIVATRSGHYIHLDQPELVDNAVAQIVGRIRGNRVSWATLAEYGAHLN